MFSLSGRVALITGGSRGLGFEIARTLGRSGAKVVITARNSDELEHAAEVLRFEGIETLPLHHDVADLDSTAPLIERISQDIGDLDILVNNAGATWGGPAASLEWAGWEKVINVNLNGTWCLTQTVASTMMLPRQTGSIIFISSIAGLGAVAPTGIPTVAYNTTKAAQLNLMRQLASEWSARGVRVNAIAPGWFETKMASKTIHDTQDHVLPRVPAGRWGVPATDIGGPALFLASQASSYVTGHTLVVDGGMSIVI